MADKPAPDFSDQIQSLIEPIRKDDPNLFQALEFLNNSLSDLNKQINPITPKRGFKIGDSTIDLGPPVTFFYTLPGRTIKMEWVAISGTAQYEIRRGASWDTALFQTKTSSTQINLEPIPTGTYTYLLKTITLGGTYSDDATPLVVIIESVAPVSISAQVIDNNVLLRWTEPHASFDIDYYELFKNGVSIGYNDGNFSAIFETAAGSFNYGVVAYDMAGNASPISTILVAVNQPPDFELFNTFISSLNGTRVNAYREAATPPRLVAPVDVAQTWDQHFSSHSWTTIQNQIDAGYPVYAQPAIITGSYEEIIDFGVLINNIIANITYNFAYNDPNHQVSIIIKQSVSTDGISYSTPVAGAVQFFSTLRYLKVRLEFTGVDDKAFVSIYNLTVKLDVKRDLDSGEVNALATDVNGTQVNFNKAFKDIDSITLSTQSVKQPIVAIYNFVDVPNPVGFKVFAFDSTGNRVSYLVSWKARGII